MSALPHALPYVLFVAIAMLTDVVPPGFAPWIDAVRVVVVGAVLIALARSGAYPELRVRTPRSGTRARATALALTAGVLVGLVWIPLGDPDLVPLLGERGGFDTAAPYMGVRIAFRLAALCLVVPFAEELLVRSQLPRWVDAGDGDWRDAPVGVFSVRAFVIAVAFFTVTHPEWLAALVTAVIWMLLLAHTRRLRDVVLSHAVANAVFAVQVLEREEWQWW